ncbi:ABC transporter-like protein 12 [Dinothrombium tinctorium]|uniref:ABC transporter-like protein 12 n=1 Tax=Dinothrombium tinctorium TaxID=1965070 RepID=A0A3S3PHG9_9ACAR|nr:ABC transporter-like protein 12 [Dinothrombium tinctorium]RWS09726.1 ABC transporter-like protein 12 [Dinothrombium tinctorium]RWS09944.1 ABC transporter-like protein 12 [Dinothrombium tinctorium]
MEKNNGFVCSERFEDIGDDFTVKMDSEERVNLMSSENVKVSLTWLELSYAIEYREWSKLLKFKFKDAVKMKTKQILQTQSGQIATGSLTAIMGKSGSGKSSLIELLSGRRTKGLNGNIFVTTDCSNGGKVDLTKVRIAFLPQQECLINVLTVRESIIYASKIKNHKFDESRHEKICEQLLVELSLEQCRNVRLLNCSGGERKRVTVALELVSKPTILIMDEPTSGLDSNSAIQCVQMLKKLTQSEKNPLGILVTIHQPSIKVLHEFHHLYLLSHNGRCIYNGAPTQLLSYFNDFNLQCPQFYNPADYAIEVASGDYGEDVLHEMDALQQKQKPNAVSQIKLTEVIKSMTNSHSCLASARNTCILTKRTTVTTFRDPVLNSLRLIVHIVVAFVMITLFGFTAGKESGCIINESNSNTTKTISFQKLRDQQVKITQNLSFMVFTLIFFIYTNMTTTIMAFPWELSVFVKERTNGWYSCLSYYIAKTVADLPFVFILTSFYAFAIYYFTGQPVDIYRISIFWAVAVILALIGQSVGMMVGAILVNNVNAAVFLGPVLCFPSIILCGFFVKIETIPFYLKPIAVTSFVRYALEAIIICVYGFKRCFDTAVELPKQQITPQTVVDFIKYLGRLNITYSSARPFIEYLATEHNQSLDELRSFDEKFESFDISELDTTKLNTLVNYDVVDETESFVLYEFNVKNEDIYFELFMLLTILIVIRIFTYFVLAFKVNRRGK